MSKIRVMSEHLSNRIAAGEVIERPASVVKELVENAIDAGAHRIRIEVERAGARLISVQDDGSGMDADDALLCIEPHGTSKLFDEAGIDRITTLGFRGEALPSIASVSRFLLRTRTSGMLEATQIRVEGGKLLEAAPAGGPVGTQVQIRDLFFNTPARKKFLKSPATEAHHIEETVLAMAIPRPEIGFELILDGRTAFNSPPAATPEARIREFFGRPFADSMWPVNHRENNISVTGFTASPGFTRNSRREQRTFVNGRAVESPAIYRGIRDGYATLTEHGRYAPAILFLEMPPEDVDVNVHPAKREVRFRHEFAVTRAVTAAIGNALKRSRTGNHSAVCENQLPLSGQVPLSLVLDSATVHYRPKNDEQPELAIHTPPPGAADADRYSWTETITPEAADAPEKLPSPVPAAAPEHGGTPENSAASRGVTPALDLTDRTAAPAEREEALRSSPQKFSPPEAPFNGDWPTEVLGILDRTYILAAGRSGLVIIDQHAAHERIMFEHLLRDAARGVPSQPLLLPQTLELPHPMRTLLLRHAKLFASLGFDFEPMGNNTLMLNAIPLEMPTHRPLTEMIPDMLQELLDNADNRIPVELEYIARAACHAAVRAHDELPLESARELLRQLGECRQGTLCPHGRPTMITITIKELEKRFARR